MDVGGATLPSVVAEFEAHRLGGELEGEQLRPADAAFFRTWLAAWWTPSGGSTL
jgi:N utilization substance protein B